MTAADREQRAGRKQAGPEILPRIDGVAGQHDLVARVTQAADRGDAAVQLRDHVLLGASVQERLAEQAVHEPGDRRLHAFARHEGRQRLAVREQMSVRIDEPGREIAPSGIDATESAGDGRLASGADRLDRARLVDEDGLGREHGADAVTRDDRCVDDGEWSSHGQKPSGRRWVREGPVSIRRCAVAPKAVRTPPFPRRHADSTSARSPGIRLFSPVRSQNSKVTQIGTACDSSGAAQGSGVLESAAQRAHPRPGRGSAPPNATTRSHTQSATLGAINRSSCPGRRA